MRRPVSELRRQMTNREFGYWMKMFELYPMGEEAADLRSASIVATLQSGIATVQVKRGKSAKIKSIFKREFWYSPSGKLWENIVGIFKTFGMRTDDDG